MDDVREQFDGPDGRYCWRQLGHGRPLLLLNGYAATADDWDPTFLGALGASASVICPDHRGMGESALGERPLTIESMAADAIALLDHLGLERVALAGWSMGGFVAQALAVAAPQRVESLILLSTDGGGPDAIRCDASDWARLTDRSGTPREQASRLIELLFPPPVAEVIDRDFGDVVAAARERLDPVAVDGQEAAIDAWYATSQPQLPAGPRLAAAGVLDRVIPAANAATLATGGDGWCARFAGGGHAFMAQKPDRLARLIGAFLHS